MPRAEHADDEIGGVEHAEQDGQAPEPVQRQPSEDGGTRLRRPGGDEFGTARERPRRFGTRASDRCREALAARLRGVACCGEIARELPIANAQPVLDLRVAREEQDREPACRERQPVEARGDALRGTGDRRLDSRRIGRVEPGDARRRHRLGQASHAFPQCRDRRHDVDAERLRKRRQVEPHPACRRFVAHVEREHQRQPGLRERQRDRQAAPQVLGVGDLHQRPRVLAEQRAHRGALVGAARRKRQHAGGVEQRRPALETQRRARDLDRRAGVVGDIGVGAGEPMEDHRLADVRRPDEDVGRAGRARWADREGGVCARFHRGVRTGRGPSAGRVYCK